MDSYIESVAKAERLRARAHLRRLVDRTRKEYGMPTLLQEEMRAWARALSRLGLRFGPDRSNPYYRSPHMTPGAVDLTVFATPAEDGASDVGTPGLPSQDTRPGTPNDTGASPSARSAGRGSDTLRLGSSTTES